MPLRNHASERSRPTGIIGPSPNTTAAPIPSAALQPTCTNSAVRSTRVITRPSIRPVQPQPSGGCPGGRSQRVWNSPGLMSPVGKGSPTDEMRRKRRFPIALHPPFPGGTSGMGTRCIAGSRRKRRCLPARWRRTCDSGNPTPAAIHRISSEASGIVPRRRTSARNPSASRDEVRISASLSSRSERSWRAGADIPTSNPRTARTPAISTRVHPRMDRAAAAASSLNAVGSDGRNLMAGEKGPRHPRGAPRPRSPFDAME